MKISEAEERLIQDYTDELLEAFKIALKRVPKSSRCQHCYTTAVAIHSQYTAQAVALIQYGLSFCDNRVDEMRSYTNMAILYEKNLDYANALFAYQKALDAVDTGQLASYRSSFAADMMRVAMHLHRFAYTDQLEDLYGLAVQEDKFGQSFQKKIFYRTLAEIIIFAHKQDNEAVKAAIRKADRMLCTNDGGPLTDLLKQKGFIDSIGATNEALFFLKRMKSLYI